ncbi:MAG TPA: hypothetical protein VHX67_08875 [Acidimicrobiales bacterium]|jgi:hypothetical protein|nr:hypothetical protein [Acidimicrobiales bacterium]
MRGRIRIAAVGLMATTLLCAVSSGAGAQSNTWSVQSNGGFVSLSLLNTLQFAGGGSEADASNSPVAEASGTGACLSTASSTNPCPTSATSSLSGMASTTTQDAVAHGSGVTATPTGSSSCTVPIDTGLINVNVSCGTASAAEDGNGNPTASGTGSLANVSISLSLTDVLQSLLGGSLPSASSVCDDVPAASGTAGSNSNPLAPSVQALLGTVNGILPANLALNPTSVAGGSDVSGECSVLSGLLSQLNAANSTSPVTGLVTGILNQVLGLTGGNAASVEPLSIDLGGSTSSVTTNGSVVTDSVTQHTVDVNLFGLADLQVAPTTASVALDRSTGTVTPSCNAGLASYSTSGSLPTFVNITQLTSLVNQILSQVGASSALGSALGSLLTGIIDYTPDGNLLTCDTSAPGTTASAKVGVLNLGLLAALQGGIGLNVGDVSVTGSSTNAVPAVATSPGAAPAATPAAAPAPVPGVTTVHTGEFWAGTLPIILMAGMGLAGLLLIGRRRVASLARSLSSPIRRRGGQ